MLHSQRLGKVVGPAHYGMGGVQIIKLQVTETKIVSAEGIESATQRNFNNMQLGQMANSGCCMWHADWLSQPPN